MMDRIKSYIFSCKSFIYYLILFLIILATWLCPALAYYQKTFDHAQSDYKHSIKNTVSNEKASLVVLDNCWDANENYMKKQIVTYKTNNIHYIDKFELWLPVYRHKKMKFVSMEDSIANVIYSNLKLKKMIDEYMHLRKRQKEYYKKLESVSWFNYNDQIQNHNYQQQNNVSYKEKMEDDYRRIVGQIRSQVRNHDRGIYDVRSFGRTLNDTALKSFEQIISNAYAPASGINENNPEDNKFQNENIRELQRDDIEQVAQRQVKKPRMTGFFTEMLNYIMSNKGGAAIFCLILLFLVTYLRTSMSK